MWYLDSKDCQVAPLFGADRILFLDGLSNVYRFIHGDQVATDDDLFVEPDDDVNEYDGDGFLWNQLEGSQRFVVLWEVARALIEEAPRPPEVFTVYHRSALWMIAEGVNGTVSCEIDEGENPDFRMQTCSAWDTIANRPFTLQPDSTEHEDFQEALHVLFIERFLDGVEVRDELPRLPSAQEAQMARKYLDCAIQLADLAQDQWFMWRLAWAVSQATTWDAKEDASGSLAPNLRFKIKDKRLYVIPFDGLSIDTIFDSHVDVAVLLSKFSPPPTCDWSRGELLIQGEYEGELCEVFLWPTTIGYFWDDFPEFSPDQEDTT